MRFASIKLLLLLTKLVTYQNRFRYLACWAVGRQQSPYINVEVMCKCRNRTHCLRFLSCLVVTLYFVTPSFPVGDSETLNRFKLANPPRPLRGVMSTKSPHCVLVFVVTTQTFPIVTTAVTSSGAILWPLQLAIGPLTTSLIGQIIILSCCASRS